MPVHRRRHAGCLGADGLVATAVLGLGTPIALGPATSGAGAVVSWIGAQSVLVLAADVPVLLAIVFAGAGYLILRRTVP